MARWKESLLPPIQEFFVTTSQELDEERCHDFDVDVDGDADVVEMETTLTTMPDSNTRAVCLLIELKKIEFLLLDSHSYNYD